MKRGEEVTYCLIQSIAEQFTFSKATWFFYTFKVRTTITGSFAELVAETQRVIDEVLHSATTVSSTATNY